MVQNKCIPPLIDISNFMEKVYDKEEIRNGGNKMKSRFFRFMVMAITIVLLLAACSNDDEEVEEPAPEPDEQTEEIPELEEEEAEEVLQTYEETYQNVTENAEEDGEVTGFDSLEELQQEFLTIVSEELAEDITDTYFEENEEGSIYINTSEEPAWFDEEETYELEKVEDGLYEVEQEQMDHMLLATYSILWDEEKWIVSDAATEEIPVEEDNAFDNEAEADSDTDQSGQEDSTDNQSADEGTNELTNEETADETNGETLPENDTSGREDIEGDQTSPDSEVNDNTDQNEADSGSTEADTSDDTDSDNSEDNQNSDSVENEEENGEQPAGEIDESAAESIVKAYLDMDNEDLHYVTDHQDENGNFVVQVYSIVGQGESSQTSTYGWFIVNKDTGEVEPMG